MKKLKILTLLCIFSAVAIFTSCTQVHRDITPILDEIGFDPITIGINPSTKNHDYYSMTVWSTEKGLVTKIQPKENFWNIDNWTDFQFSYSDENGRWWNEQQWGGGQNILNLQGIVNWVDEAKAFYFTYPFVEKGRKYTLAFSLNYGYRSTIEITSDYDVLGEVDNDPFFKSWNVISNTAYRIGGNESQDYKVIFNGCSFPNNTDFYKISDYNLGFRNYNSWSDQSGTLWGFLSINNNVDFENKCYSFKRNTKYEDKLHYEITPKIKPKVSETMDFFDGSETVTIPYGNLEIYTTRTYELQIRNW